MKKFHIWTIIFFLGGVVSFGIALFAYHSYQDYLAVLAYYGISEETYLKTDKIAEVIFNFKFGIIKYTFFGFIAWIIGIYFLLKSFKGK